MPDYIPGSDAEYDTWINNFVNYATDNSAALGLVAGDVTLLSNAQAAWTTAYNAHVAAAAAAQGARASKDNARTSSETTIRDIVRRLQASSSVDDQERAALGITIPEEGRTPVPVPTTPPTAFIKAGQRLQHTIDFRDASNSSSRAKPFGVQGAEIYRALTAAGAPAPIDPSQFQFVALDTASPYVVDFDGADGGKNGHYIIRWVNTRGQRGPWSEVFSATINA